MPTYIHNTHKIQNTLNAFTDAVYVPNCRCNLIRPYSKALENFHIAFSKEKYAKIENLFEKNRNDFNATDNEWDVPEPLSRSLNKRVTYFLAGCLYFLPFINSIIYIALNRFQPLEPYKVLTYEEVIEKARKQFKNNPNHIQILERISKRLEDCHYREAVLNDKRPQIDLIESDSYKTGIVKGSFDYGREKNEINYEAIKFIHHLPKMHIASVPEY